MHLKAASRAPCKRQGMENSPTKRAIDKMRFKTRAMDACMENSPTKRAIDEFLLAFEIAI